MVVTEHYLQDYSGPLNIAPQYVRVWSHVQIGKAFWKPPRIQLTLATYLIVSIFLQLFLWSMKMLTRPRFAWNCFVSVFNLKSSQYHIPKLFFIVVISTSLNKKANPSIRLSIRPLSLVYMALFDFYLGRNTLVGPTYLVLPRIPRRLSPLLPKNQRYLLSVYLLVCLE